MTAPKKAALKPCPFCGSDFVLVHRAYPLRPAKYSVLCCECIKGSYPTFRSTKAFAISAWNRRKP